jgi:hypothetical protein
MENTKLGELNQSQKVGYNYWSQVHRHKEEWGFQGKQGPGVSQVVSVWKDEKVLVTFMMFSGGEQQYLDATELYT